MLVARSPLEDRVPIRSRPSRSDGAVADEGCGPSIKQHSFTCRCSTPGSISFTKESAQEMVSDGTALLNHLVVLHTYLLSELCRFILEVDGLEPCSVPFNRKNPPAQVPYHQAD